MTDSMETLIGGRDVVAKFLDGSTETVRIQQFKIRRMDEYLKTIDDEPARIELAADKPKGWADNLTPDSHTELLAATEGLNADTFFAWLRRRVERQERLAPGSSGELGKQLLSGSKTG
jgi:hypothetical protein